MGIRVEYKPNHGIYYGDMPSRKSKAIVVQEGSVIYTVAYFRNEEAYRRFKLAMMKVLGAYET